MLFVRVLLILRNPSLLVARALSGCIEMILHELENLVTWKGGCWCGKTTPPNLFGDAGSGICGSGVRKAFGAEATLLSDAICRKS